MKYISGLVLLLSLMFGQASACDLQVMHGVPIYGSDVECSALTSFEDAGPDDTVVIPAGETVTLTEQATVLDVLVRGELVIQAPIAFRTMSAPSEGGLIRIHDGAELIFRDGGFADYDAEQWGHGLLSIGGGEIRCETDDWRVTRSLVASEIEAGSTIIQLPSKPHGWRAGDTLALPDTRQPDSEEHLSEWTETVEILSITADGIVYLTAPVQHDHLGWHDSDGILQKLFDIGNLSQPITFRGENPDGVRGHVAGIAGGGLYLKGVQATEGMGRTTTAPLGADNRVGRYALWHFHHYYGLPNETRAWQGEAIHCSVWDSPKWPGSIHNAHFTNIEDCIAFDCAGGGLITEQTLSYGFQIKDCMVVAKSPGSGLRITDRSDRADDSPTADHWHDRVGLGLGSAWGIITGNRLYCAKDSIGMAGFSSTTMKRPIERGNNKDLIWHRYDPYRYPLWFDTSDNVAWGGWRLIETWTMNCYPVGTPVERYSEALNNRDWTAKPDPAPNAKLFPGLTAVHCQRGTDFEDQRETTTYGWTFLGDFAKAEMPSGGAAGNSVAIDFKDKYEFGHQHFNLTVRGLDYAYESVTPSQHVQFVDSTFEVPCVMYEPLGRLNNSNSVDVEFKDCEFIPVNGSVVFNGGLYPKYDLDLWLQAGRTDRHTLKPMRYHVRPWRDGRDYDVYHYQQLASYEHKKGPPPDGKTYGDWPAGVWTHQQLIDAGTPIFGAVVPDTAVTGGDWGLMYANDVTPDCCERVEQLREEIKRLKMELEDH